MLNQSQANIDDFDEEINGINLSKLFSVYGPNSLESRKALLNKRGISQYPIEKNIVNSAINLGE